MKYLNQCNVQSTSCVCCLKSEVGAAEASYRLAVAGKPGFAVIEDAVNTTACEK